MIDLAPAEEIAGRADTEREMGLPPCLFCSTPLRHTVVDLGMSPLCETFLEAAAQFATVADGALMPLKPVQRPGGITTSEATLSA